MMRSSAIRRSLAKFRVPLTPATMFMRAESLPEVFTCPLPPPLNANNNSVIPSPTTAKPTLVLDIDETLVCATGKYCDASAAPNARDVLAMEVWLRPYLTEFLSEVTKLFEVVFWTAGIASYAYGMVHLFESLLQLPHATVYDPHLKVPFQPDEGNAPVAPHFYVLARNETIASKEYMKFMPLIGRPMSRVLMIDDNPRSFPLTPRNGIRCNLFSWGNEHVSFMKAAQAQGCLTAVAGSAYEGELDPNLWKPDAAKAASTELFQPSELHYFGDTTLLDLLPMLRKAAAAEDVTRELDHWRPADYIQCDDFKKNMDHQSIERRKLLGVTTVMVEKFRSMHSGAWRTELAEGLRNAEPIAKLSPRVHNFPLLEEARQATEGQRRRGK
jgi:hypothetical protein